MKGSTRKGDRRPDVLAITIVSDESTWLNGFIPELVTGWRDLGHAVTWRHDGRDAEGGDICFLLSYGEIVPLPSRSRFKACLVVHASDLPHGRGWSPMTWQILEGRDRIAVTLLEAADRVDSGPIYDQISIALGGHELAGEWRQALAAATLELCRRFVAHYPAALDEGREQSGEASAYARRRPEDSRLDPHRSLAEQFDLLRVVDNDRYPAFFDFRGNRYILRISKYL